MKNKLLTLLVVFGFTLPGLAQSSDSVSYKNHLGVIAKKVNDEYFKEKNPLIFGFLFKRQITPSYALRFGSLTAFNKKTHNYANWAPFFRDSIFTTTRVDIIIGFEKQNSINKRLSFAYGVDVEPYLSKQNQNKTSRFPSGNIIVFEETNTELKTKGILLQPFLDIRYQLSSKAYIAIDTRPTIDLAKKTFEISGTRGEEGSSNPGQITGSSERQSISMIYTPISSIQLVFKL